MNEQASFRLRGRNPDVLTCIANLSNDEVFTPPEFANRMLDTLAEAWAAANDGADLWADSSVRFLDPCTKSGVLLREIASRLTKGLAAEIPDLQERVDHILTKQVFGIGITYLTSLLARRSVYCSKHAQGEYSIAKSFGSDAGNIWFERMEHAWVDRRCRFCVVCPIFCTSFIVSVARLFLLIDSRRRGCGKGGSVLCFPLFHAPGRFGSPMQQALAVCIPATSAV